MPTSTPDRARAEFEAGYTQEPATVLPLPQWVETFDSDQEAEAFIAACLRERVANGVEQLGQSVYLKAASPGLLQQSRDLARGWRAYRNELQLARSRFELFNV
jgi:hypothetical protein